MNQDQRVEKLRRSNNERLPIWYSWRVHLFGNAAILFGVALVSFSVSIESLFILGWMSLALFVLFFFVWALIEYGIHRFVLHGSRFVGAHFHRQHSVFHHGYFTDELMTVSSPVDVNRVLLYPIDLIVLLGANASLAAVIGWIGGSAPGALFFLSGLVYLAVYEVAHGMSHLDRKWTNSILLKIASHHRVHHSPLKMRGANFAVVLPVIDTIFGTDGRSK